MNKKLELAQDNFIHRIGNLCRKFGLNNFMAQLFTVLYLSDKPLSLDELAGQLKASKGNVSINIRNLEEWGAVKKIWVKGSRKDYYQAETNLKKILSDRVKSSLQKHLTEVSGMLDEFNHLMESTHEEMSDEDKRIAKVYKERLKKIEEIKSLVSTAMVFADKIF